MLGRATTLGTEYFAKKHSLTFNRIPLLNLYASPIGIGSFRLNLEHQPVIERAIERGLNFIDSSSHFQKGMAEITIGKALQNQFRAGLDRSEVIVCSKAGFIFGKGSGDGIYHIKQDNYHSIHPKFLEDEITKSLANLQLETLDIFYLNNPERLLQTSKRLFGPEQVYEMIQIAFKHLDKEVERGRIASYGITSNSLAMKMAEDHLSLERILDSKPKHLAAVQFPLNMYELDAIEPGLDGSMSLSEICDASNIYTVTQRPFNAITPDGVRKLVIDRTIEEESTINDRATKQFELVSEMEYDLSMTMGSNAEDLALSSKFVIAQVLAQNLARLVDNGMAADLYFKRDILPVLDKDLKELEAVCQTVEVPETKMFLQEWLDAYKPNVLKLMKYVLDISKWHSNRSNENLLNLVSLNAYKNQSLEVNALGASLSANPNGTVLSGLRKMEHLENILQALKLEHLSPEQLEYISDTLKY